MELTFDGESVRGKRAARERFYDSRGYGKAQDGDLVLAPVEAAHLLFRGDVEWVRDRRVDADGRRMNFREFLASTAVSEVEFFVYKDLRDRGFYLSTVEDDSWDFVVFPRGDGPWDGTIAYRILVVGERTDVSTGKIRSLSSPTAEGGSGVLAVVDEESEVTYLEVDDRDVSGATNHDVGAVVGELLADRVLVWEPPEALHHQAFYGQPVDKSGEAVQLSLVEAAYLAGEGILDLEAGGDGENTPGSQSDPTDATAIIERGRTVEGERFDRRLVVYAALRDAGIVPKTGFKFGADFRTYADVDSVDDLGHSELLVRVLPAEHTFTPRDLSLDVRLAHGVRKTMLFALVGVDDGIEWYALTRLTP